MKSREEYQASIFAKRDALLKKRKKHFAQAVTGAGAAVLLAVSFIAVPDMTKKLSLSSDTTIPSVQTTHSAVCEDYVTQDQSDFVNHTEKEEAIESYTENETTTLIFKATSGKTEDSAASSATEECTDADEAVIDSAESVEEVTTSDETTKRNGFLAAIMSELINGKTEPYAEYPADTGGDDNVEAESIAYAPQATDYSNDYTQEEIISAAIIHLPDDAKEFADPENAFVTVTRTAEGEEYYEVWFDINGSNHKIRLNAETLEHIAVDSNISFEESTTSKPSISQISPPYNPN